MEQLPKIIHESWHPLIAHLFDDDSMKFLKYQVLRLEHFYPERINVFKVFRMRVEDVRVVILGQDPYSKKGQATGLAFAVSEDTPIPPSLRVVREDNDIILENFDKSLEKWEAQGVFLLNAALTVRKGDPGSHVKYWAYFTHEVIKALSQHHPCIYLLWGEKAKAFESCIHHPKIIKYKSTVEGVTLTRNIVIEASHPASELYTDGKGGFFGGYHFNKVNWILRQSVLPEINF